MTKGRMKWSTLSLGCCSNTDAQVAHCQHADNMLLPVVIETKAPVVSWSQPEAE